MKNIKMVIQYDGTDFCGSQIQPNVRTVQEEMEREFSKYFNQEIKIQFSGRTDSGVHAYRQVVNFKVDTAIPADKVFYPLRKLMPDDIQLISSEEVPLDFNSRFGASFRRYRYFIRKNPNLFRNRYSLICHKELDIDKLNDAAQLFFGKHDFESFCASKSEVSNHICTIEYIKFFRVEDEVVFEIKANRFLHNMCRILVATFIEVNNGNLTKDDLLEILNKKDRRAAPKTISPKGLFLWEIGY